MEVVAGLYYMMGIAEAGRFIVLLGIDCHLEYKLRNV